MQKILIIILIVMLVSTTILAVLNLPEKIQQKNTNKKTATIIVGNKTITAEIAKTEKEITKGLSGRKSLAKDKGMLFVFPDIGLYTFWMKDTLIPLDIIWILDDEIVDIKTLQPETPDSIPTYASPNEVNYVLEVNAGFAKENNVKIGDKVKIEY